MSCARALARGESARLTAIARARSTSTIYPVFIKPLFNKLEPLEPGSLRDGIESLAKTVGFPLRKLFVMDGSKRSSHSNAFLFGFGSNQSIVLFDTLVKQVKEEKGAEPTPIAEEPGKVPQKSGSSLCTPAVAVVLAMLAKLATL